MKRLYGLILITVAVLMISACSNFLNRKMDYLKQRDGRKLVIPAGLSNKKVGDAYQIPAGCRPGPVPASVKPLEIQ